MIVCLDTNTVVQALAQEHERFGKVAEIGAAYGLWWN